MSSTSAGVWARSVTTPSDRTGTDSGQLSPPVTDTRSGVLGAERISRVDAEHLHLGGEERQLVERPPDREVVRMPVDLGQELGGGELAADHVALELRHVDAVGGETAERF